MSYIKPSVEQTSELLGMLYGGEVEVGEIEGVSEAAYTATFVNPEGELVAACVCDPAMVIYSGAALSMMPKGGAEDMLKEGEYSKSVVDNFHEVMNICTRLMMSNDSAHLKLKSVFPSAQVEGEIGSLKTAKSVAFELDIPRYGKGKLHFLLH